MSSVRVPRRCEVENSVFTTPGDVSPVAEYDAGKLLDLHVDLKQLSLKYNCLQKLSQVVIHLPNLSYEEILHATTSTKNEVVTYAQR